MLQNLNRKSAYFLFTFFVLFCGPVFSASLEGMAVMGDSGEAGAELDNLRRSLQNENVKSVVMPGDNLYSGSYSSVWDSWKQNNFRFDVVALGNHNSGYQEEIKYFEMSGEFYSVVKNGARFIVLNSDNKTSVETQFAWLETEITQVREPLIFLVYHHPTFKVGYHGWEERKEFQIKMRQFLKIHGAKITALLMGHDHISSFISFGDVPAVIAGSARETKGATTLSYNEAGFQIQTRYLAPKAQHWALLEIEEGAKEATIHFVRVSDQKRVCSAHFGSVRMQLLSNC